MRFSFSTVLIVFAFGYFAFTAWSLYGVFFPSDCRGSRGCLWPSWKPTDEFKIEISFGATNNTLSSDYFPLKDGIVIHQNITPPASVFQNQTFKVHVTISDTSGAVWTSYPVLTMHKEPIRTAFNLLKEKPPQTAGQPNVDERPVNFWLSVLRIYVLQTPVVLNQHEVPQEIISHLRVYPSERSTYLPVFYVNPEMQKSTDWIQVPAVNSGKLDATDFPVMQFTVSVEPQSIGKFRLRCTLGMLASQLRSYGFRPKDIDEMRQLLVDTNFYFLLTTMFVSVFHLLFDFLAFKNDISFWRKAENTAGLSMRTVVWRFVSSLVITLHLLEERSSLLVTIPMGISTCIELWKLGRIFKVSFSFRHGVTMGTRSQSETETDRLDAEFMFWLQCLMIPLCLAGSVYSLLYTPHRSWYSWCLQTLVHGVYAFGFLFMTPQLFINYRLKSVAHLPWKALTYKAFNTFIDDFFAMIIVMPTSHRIACLRDDVVFLIYLYQRWLYPVDKTRVNEYGMRGDPDEHKNSAAVKDGDANQETCKSKTAKKKDD